MSTIVHVCRNKGIILDNDTLEVNAWYEVDAVRSHIRMHLFAIHIGLVLAKMALLMESF